MTTTAPTASFGASAPRQHSALLPASPTLTNPDLILPDYDRSPSPVALAQPRQSQSVWNHSTRAAQASGEQNAMYTSQSLQYNAYTPANASVNITTPIIYGNGTMLSDIGEVTEAESTPARPSPPRNRHAPIATSTAIPSPNLKVDDSEGDAALRSSPTIGKNGALSGVKKRAKAAQRERRASTDSNSTITDQHPNPRIAVFDNFDDSVSVEDSVFQGDDEESLASSYVDDASAAGAPALNSRDSGQKYSTAQLSRRAEQILANAKKRLTHMEDNLTRARSSLLVAPGYPGSSPSSPSPPVARASAALMSSATAQTAQGSGHNRTASDNALRIGIPIRVYPQRSSSVLGIPSDPRHPGLTVSRSADQLNGHFNRQRASYMVVRELEPLGEDHVSHPHRRSDIGNLHRLSSFESATFGEFSERGLSRSASTSHMRDIRDQVNDLKGKITSLREQARADSLKRNSIQNLRTPSPFTHAKIDQWYSNSLADFEPPSQPQSHDIPSWSRDAATRDSTQRGELGAFEHVASADGGSELEEYEFENADRLDQLSPDPFELEIARGAEDDSEDMLTEYGDAEEPDNEHEEACDDDVDMVSESGDSIYLETVQHHISHEDREDAFDYEHFFLHSAMGTISQKVSRRASNASFDSEDSEASVETTRPFAETGNMNSEQPPRLPSMTRRGSDASVSTTQSFATAEEGLLSRQGSRTHLRQEEVEEDDDDEGPGELLPEAFPELQSHSEAFVRPETPQREERATLAGLGSPTHTASLAQGQGIMRLDDMNSAVRRPMSSRAMIRPHAPSVSSFESTGTTRSFPLVKRPASKSSGSSGIPTPEGRSSESDGKTTSSILFSGRTSQHGDATNEEGNHSISLHSTSSTTSLIEKSGTTAVLETLPRDDRFLVERLVASLGRCVLGLTENSRASTEARMYRRRIDAARKILEGFEQA